MNRLRLAILGSTRGTDMLALIAATQQQQLDASIELVISNKPEALILQRAQEWGLRTLYLDPQGLTREEYDQKISAVLVESNINLVILIGYMRILSSAFVAQWNNRIINIHPSLLPAFAGERDHNVHQAVLAAKIEETGCTVHLVTEEVDQGPILVQKKCAVLPQDSVETLKKRVQALEEEALIEAVTLFGTNR